MIKNSKEPELQVSGSERVGQVGALHGDRDHSSSLDMLFKPDMDIDVRTEVVWAIGKVPDKRAIEPLHKLDREVQAMRT